MTTPDTLEALREARDFIAEVSLFSPGKQQRAQASQALSRIDAALAEGEGKNMIGAAELEVGQAVYLRIEALMNANPKPGTPEWRELDYLSFLVSSVEEVGGYDGLPPASPAPTLGVEEVARIIEAELVFCLTSEPDASVEIENSRHVARAIIAAMEKNDA